jgi:DNA-binding transcriptional LysR family regulator
MLDLNDLYFFAGVVKHGGFSPASRALGIPKSRLSKHVARLELRLGVRLIERTTRRFQVTEPGEILFEQANSVVAGADAAENLMASARSDPRGLVRVSCPPGLARHLEAVLPGFLESYPLVRVHVTVVNRQVDLIDERIHVAVRVRSRLDTDPLFTVRVLGTVRSVLVASPAFVARLERDLVIEDLANLDTLVHSDLGGANMMRLVGPHGRTLDITHEPRLSFGDFDVLRRLAIDGMGVALIPKDFCKDELQSGALVRVLPDWATPEAIVHAIFTTRQGLPPAVRAFIDRLARDFPKLGS